MSKSLKLAAMLLAVVAVIATGCHKENNGGGDTPTETSYTVTFNANGGTGTMESQIFTEGQLQALTANAFSYEGYAFAGWNTKADGTGTAYTDQQTITITDNMTLYAQWLKGYIVTFNANGGTGTMQPQTFTDGETKALTANAFTWENHEFIGWNTAADGTGTVYADSQEIIVEENLTIYAQWMAATGKINDHYYVDLGLPSGTLWATCNIGADNPIAYGDYFAWGETQPQASNTYNWSSYKYCNGSYNTLTKYCNSAVFGNNGFTDTFRVLLPEDDAATANWGNGWRMPTRAELRELKDNCTVTWTTQNGVNGRLFTAANGNSVFLPAVGSRWDGSLFNYDSYGVYWSSSLCTDLRPDDAWYLYFFSDGYYMSYDGSRGGGHSVRPVCASQK